METYPLKPNRISVVQSSFKTNIVEFENGVEQRSPKWSMRKRIFKLEHQCLTNFQVNLLLDFFERMQGSFRKFIFNNHIDNLAYYVRFKDDTFNIERINANFANISVEVIEC